MHRAKKNVTCPLPPPLRHRRLVSSLMRAFYARPVIIRSALSLMSRKVRLIIVACVQGVWQQQRVVNWAMVFSPIEMFSLPSKTCEIMIALWDRNLTDNIFATCKLSALDIPVTESRVEIWSKEICLKFKFNVLATLKFDSPTLPLISSYFAS